METKEDLMRQVADLQAQVNELNNQLHARDAMLASTGEEGYLVTSPNPAYTGVTSGVEFKNGRAFVPDSFKDAERIVLRLVNDFGYRAQKMGANEYQSLAQPVVEKKPMGMEALVGVGQAAGVAR